MRVIVIFLAALALAGFFASVAVHVGGYFGVSEPFGLSPWPLHAASIAIWLPGAYVAKKLAASTPNGDILKIVMSRCPSWVTNTFYVLFAYAFGSFAVFWVKGFFGIGDESDSNTLRGFSGHWIVFNFAAFAVFYSYTRNQAISPARLCTNGHTIGKNANRCPVCGEVEVENPDVPS